MENYKPSAEEINKAEEMMTDEQKKTSREREASLGIENTKKPADSLEQNPEKESHVLAAVPIFRNNDLYQAVFPEIKPLFEKGEELDEKTSVKKIMDRIVENKDKAVILDGTCLRALAYAKLNLLKLDDFPAEFGLKELPISKGKGPWGDVRDALDLETIKSLLKTHLNIDFSGKDEDTIDRKIREQFNADFSSETAKDLLEIAQIKNPNIKRVYVLTSSIADHFSCEKLLKEPGGYLDSAKEIEVGMPLALELPGARREFSDWSFKSLKDLEKSIEPEDLINCEAKRRKKSLVSAVFKKVIQEKFGIDPIMKPTIKATDILEGDLVVVDRHNEAISSHGHEDIDKRKTRQVSLLPIESELRNNEEYLGKEFANPNFIKSMRAKFEKKK